MDEGQEPSGIDIAIKVDVNDKGDDYLNRKFRHPIHGHPKHFHMTLGYIKNVPEEIALEAAKMIKEFLDTSCGLKEKPQRFVIGSVSTWKRKEETRGRADDKTLMLFADNVDDLKAINQALDVYLQASFEGALALEWKTRGDDYVPHMKLGEPKGMSVHQAIKLLEDVLHPNHNSKKHEKALPEVFLDGYSTTVRKRFPIAEFSDHVKDNQKIGTF